MGQSAGRGITTGAGNTVVGYNLIGLSAGLTNTLILGTGAGQLVVADATSFRPIVLPSTAKAAIPAASTVGAGAMMWVTDASGGAGPFFSDGTSWMRVTLGSALS